MRMSATTIKNNHSSSATAKHAAQKKALQTVNRQQNRPSSVSSSRKSQLWVLVLAVVALLLLAFLRQETESFPAFPEFSNNSASRSVSKVNPIRQISILGERNSGTRWTYDHISECFNHSLIVKKELTRYKHWFQNDDPSRYPHDTLVLAQFRNPYEWLKAMEHVPHHSPAHLRTDENTNTSERSAGNDWQVFLTKAWTMPRVGLDLELFGNETCQEHFAYKDIVSCTVEPLPKSHYGHKLRYSENQPFYEMRNDGSGIPYDNILEMRTDKIRNFLSVADFEGVSDAWVLQYEHLVKQGTTKLVERVAEVTGIEPNCKPKPPQIRKPKQSRFISADMAAHIRNHLNWTVENMIGYEIEWDREKEATIW
jgi:hypothetical protein